MAEVKIDSKLFQERISHFAAAWKNDLRSKDGLFGGASSIVVMMGKMEEIPEFHKNNAMHVSRIAKRRISSRSKETQKNIDGNLPTSFGFLDTNSRQL